MKDIVVAPIEAVITAEADNNANELLIVWSVVVSEALTAILLVDADADKAATEELIT